MGQIMDNRQDSRRGKAGPYIPSPVAGGRQQPKEEQSAPPPGDPGPSTAALAQDPNWGLNVEQSLKAPKEAAKIVKEAIKDSKGDEHELMRILLDVKWKDKLKTTGAEFNKQRIAAGRRPVFQTDAQVNVMGKQEWLARKVAELERVVPPPAFPPNASQEERQAAFFARSQQFEQDAASMSWSELSQKYGKEINRDAALEMATLELVRKEQLAKNNNKEGIGLFSAGMKGAFERMFPTLNTGYAYRAPVGMWGGGYGFQVHGGFAYRGFAAYYYPYMH